MPVVVLRCKVSLSLPLALPQSLSICLWCVSAHRNCDRRADDDDESVTSPLSAQLLESGGDTRRAERTT